VVSSDYAHHKGTKNSQGLFPYFIHFRDDLIIIYDTIGATARALFGIFMLKRAQERESKRLPGLVEKIGGLLREGRNRNRSFL
jgi:hypothetical protein